MHLGALLISFFLEVPLWVKVLVTLLILLSMLHSLRKHAFRAMPDVVSNLVWEEGDDWVITLKNGTEHTAQMTTDGFISPWMTVLNFIDEAKRKRSVVLLPDSVTQDSFRQLRVRLRVRRNSEE